LGWGLAAAGVPGDEELALVEAAPVLAAGGAAEAGSAEEEATHPQASAHAA
jgi:hypothetical protein